MELRQWRLLRSRELAIAPYGLFNNRTFCDMIRRRRNDRTWATPEGVTGSAVSVKEEPGFEESDVKVKVEPGEEVKVKAEPTEPARLSPRKAPVVKTEPAVQAQSPKMLHVKVEAVTSSVTARTEAEAKKLEVVYDPTLIDALTECFGIAEGKTRVGGYAWEALAVLNKEKVSEWLEHSRAKQPGLLAVDKN